MDFNQQILLEFLKAFPTIIIGLIAANIAYRQYKMEKTKMDKDLFDKRFKVYKLINHNILQLHAKKKIDMNMLNIMTIEIEERHFVFSDKLNKVLKDYIFMFWEAKELELNKKFDKSKEVIQSIIDKEPEINEKLREEIKISYKK